MGVVVTTGAISCAKLQSNHHYQQTNTKLFTGRVPSCCPINSVKALKGKHFCATPCCKFYFLKDCMKDQPHLVIFGTERPAEI